MEDEYSNEYTDLMSSSYVQIGLVRCERRLKELKHRKAEQSQHAAVIIP